ncbi:MAG: hypothetical protein JSW39_10390 [Desulfobacterales bacterium]|nr:MAG: hypothetical protein JSW39_10390 [Desulfobacterales bacterium]
MKQHSKYTCRDYREEMLLLALKKRLGDHRLTDAERKVITAEIKKLEAALQLD